MAERPFGPYRLVRQVAVGGMAEIHLARARGVAGFEKYVALKMIHPNFAEDESFIQMLIDEAKISVQLQHANIAHTFDLGRVGDTYYITMEFVDGVDLYKLLRQASELDVEFPVELAAYVAKEMSLGLDYAHRKRDVAGNPLGIVHRDVSPQNVLVSNAGQVKLVDFGIAKASMKARQTAVGVIKGKYYYMSPEQAWGDVVDCRSDVFSTGIVLYEMLTGQMLYLEEDLHRLLDMVRRANIAPPSTLRRGVPPALERIVMKALQPRAADRYPSSQALASDLERFLHGTAPGFGAAEVVAFARRVLGEPQPIEAVAAAPVGKAPVTFVPSDELVRESAELRDENSMIFRLGDLRPSSTSDDGLSFSEPTAAAVPRRAAAVTAGPPARPVAPPLPRPGTASSPPPARVAAPLPRITSHVGGTAPPPLRGAPPVVPAHVPPPPTSPPPPSGATRLPAQPAVASGGRRRDQSTREIDTGAVVRATQRPDTDDASDLTHAGPPPTHLEAPRPPAGADADADEVTADLGATQLVQLEDAGGDDLGEHTVITQSPKFIDARTVADAAPPTRTEFDHDAATQALGQALRPGPAATAPALAARNPTPSVSELRRPRSSRRTPTDGVVPPSVISSLMDAAGSEPLPVARPAAAPSAASMPTMIEGQAPPMAGYARVGYPLPGGAPSGAAAPPPSGTYGPPGSLHTPVPHQAPGYPVGYPAGPQGYPAPHPGYPGQPQGYPGPHPGYPPYPGAPAGYAPGAAPNVLAPVDVRIGRGVPRWLLLALAAIAAVLVAGIATWAVIRATRDSKPASVLTVVSSPPGATVTIDGTTLPSLTPLVFRQTRPGARHEVRVELAGRQVFRDVVNMPASGGPVDLKAELPVLRGVLSVTSTPSDAEIYIGGVLRGRTPATLDDLDASAVRAIEVRHKDAPTKRVELTWPSDGRLTLDLDLRK